AGNPQTGSLPGIQEKVLPPGLYPINPREQQIDIVNIGFRENSITAELKLDNQGNPLLDDSGEPMVASEDTGIAFPSNDGFNIQMDFTAIWGIMPEQAPDVIRKFGNVGAVENKVVTPQIESICRNEGSRLGAVELLVGESRQSFQEATSTAFKKVLEDKNIKLQYGLVRHIYIPQSVREPIQQKFIADELKLTREQELLTTRTEADLEEARQTVELEGERVKVETEKKVAGALATGRKMAEETRAETKKLVAAIDRETAELLAQTEVVLGEAESNSTRMVAESRADKFRLAVAAFGSGDAFNQWVFASGLPEDMQLDMLYAGEGTFWTDLKGFSETMLGRQVQQSGKKNSAANAPASARRKAP
ncbi:MAG: band 7 protein, partial [Planctomycetaceae bacterium]|nr:band 7 protein [Planctomycetaceae bacterium]